MKRAVLIILSILTFIIAVPALIVGAVFTAIGAGDNPSLSGRLGEVHSPGYAVVSERVQVDWDYPVGTSIDLDGRGAPNFGSDDAVFIGFGATADVDAYLANAPVTLVDDLGDSFLDDRELDVPAASTLGPPGEETFWIEQSTGPGLQEIPLSLASGDYRIVAMNADASAGVDLEVHGSVDLPFLLPVGIGLLVFGGLMLVLAVVLLIFGIRASGKRPPVAPAPYGYAHQAVPPGHYPPQPGQQIPPHRPCPPGAAPPALPYPPQPGQQYPPGTAPAPPGAAPPALPYPPQPGQPYPGATAPPAEPAPPADPPPPTKPPGPRQQ